MPSYIIPANEDCGVKHIDPRTPADRRLAQHLTLSHHLNLYDCTEGGCGSSYAPERVLDDQFKGGWTLGISTLGLRECGNGNLVVDWGFENLDRI
jgi:hypothetical protein